MNSIPNKSTGFTPYRVMYGIDPKPLSTAFSKISTREGYDSILDWVTELELMEDMINDEVGENLTQSRATMKNYFDKGKVDSKIGIGDLVLLKNQNRKSSLDQMFDGPYAVIHRKGPNVLIKQRIGKERSLEKWIHLNRCKPCLPKLYFPNCYRTKAADIGLPERYGSEDDSEEEYTTVPVQNPEFEEIVSDVGPRTSNRIRKPSRKLIESEWLDDPSDDSFDDESL